MNVSDEMLGAYVDGELEASARVALEAEIARQPQLAARIAGLKRVRERLRAALDPTLHEPVPPRLMRALAAPGAKASPSWAAWTAIAAGVALMTFIGYLTLRSDAGGNLFRQHDNELVAQGALASALSEQLVSTQPAKSVVRIGVSFRNRRDGIFCRTFAVDSEELAGIACREVDAWHVRALASAEHRVGGPDGAAQAATDLPPAILAMVQNEMDGEPLDATGEAAARRKHWRTK